MDLFYVSPFTIILVFGIISGFFALISLILWCSTSIFSYNLFAASSIVFAPLAEISAVLLTSSVVVLFIFVSTFSNKLEELSEIFETVSFIRFASSSYFALLS